MNNKCDMFQKLLKFKYIVTNQCVIKTIFHKHSPPILTTGGMQPKDIKKLMGHYINIFNISLLHKSRKLF